MWQRLSVGSQFLLGAILTCGSVAGQDGLLGSWQFDEGHGDVALDSSGCENDGDIWGAQWVEGEFGTALYFDGAGSHVAIPELDGLDGSDELTVQAWVYWEGAGRYPNILSGGTWSPGGFLMFVRDDQCSFRMGRPGVSASTNRQAWREVSAPLVPQFKLRRWYHLAATFKQPVIKTYVDGRQVGTADWDYPVAQDGDLLIGKWSGNVSHRGLIDDVKIFDRALDAGEIAADFRRQSSVRVSAAEGEATYTKIPRSPELKNVVARLENEYATLAVSAQGRCTALLDRRTGEDQILHTTPLVTVKRGGKIHTRCSCSHETGRLLFHFSKAATTVTVRVTTKPHYFVFKIESVTSETTKRGQESFPAGELEKTPDPFLVRPVPVEEVAFAQLNLEPRPYAHPMSGLVANDQFGVCLRTLNLPTLVRVGGNPPAVSATAFQEHGIEQGRAALVACPTNQMRQVLQEVVQEDGVTHSPLGGPFALDAKENRGSYVFARVSEKDVEQWIELAQRGGIRTVHLNGWQQSLGHYEPRRDLYPRGIDGFKSVVDRLHEAGLKVGIHTLTGCIGTNDPWVTPVPDDRLATDGTFTLAADLTATDVDIPTAEPPGDYPTVWAYSSRGNCIRIDDELIHFSAISNESNYGFLRCQRGAFGTKVASHKKGAPVHHMIARYGCFIPHEHSSLVDEVADRIADVYNTCGLDQIYMDGAEAMRGWYGVARMREAIFKRLDRPALVEASCWDHHSWPFHSRVGAWDHPKWGLKRFADDHLRAVGQYRRACLLEAQLGWWVILGPARDWDMETPDEMEYLCAKGLAHDAPLSFQNVAAGGSPPNARQDEYMTTAGRYERLRLAGYFSDDVRERLREEREEFHLDQGDDGRWQLIPTDYSSHKVTGQDNGTDRWTVSNRFGEQRAGLRISALYSALPYDDADSLKLADFSAPGDLVTAGATAGVQTELAAEPIGIRALEACPGLSDGTAESVGCIMATNTGKSAGGAWSRVVKEFKPVVDLTPYDALGVWVHGDGRGELLNLQLTNLPEYFRTLDDHHIKVDFQGWRYFELLMRERDAAGYHDYQWPYGAHCVLHRSPLVRHAVNRLTAYLNHLPPGQQVRVGLSPVRALRTRKTVLRNPAVEIEGALIVFPTELESGMTIELAGADDCRVYDERGTALLRWLQPKGEIPVLSAGDNEVAFHCEGTEGLRQRAEVTVISCGSPLENDVPKDRVDWALLRREYEYPRTIGAVDGRQNQWDVRCRPGVESAAVEIELTVEQIGGATAAFDHPSAVTLESFEHRQAQLPTIEGQAGFAEDAAYSERGCSPGTMQKLSLSTNVAKFGRTSACYTAVSSRDDNGGWSVKCKRFQTPVDLSGFAAIGFWLRGDGGGQQFKLQLRDAQGGWQDMVTKVDFIGWRYCQFDLGAPQLKDIREIDAVNIYYNGIPAQKTVTCYVDEIRAVRESEPLRDPTLQIAGQEIRFPVAMRTGDRLVFKAAGDCRLHQKSGIVQDVKPSGAPPCLSPGRNPVVFSLAELTPRDFQVVVSLIKRYPSLTETETPQ